MDYGKAYFFFARKPNTGFKNLLLATVTAIIPAIGPIVLLGYMVVVAEWLLKDEKREKYPDYSFDLFMEYLKLGLWPFVMAMIVMVVVFIPLYGITIAGSIGIGALLKTPEVIPFLIIVGAFCSATFISIFLAPMMFYTQKIQKLDIKGALRFAKQFFKTVGGKYFVVVIINMFASSLVSFLGLLVCFVGVYPANTITQFAYEHLLVQIYDEYIKRGGEPLPEVNLPPSLAFKGYPHGPQTPEQADNDDPEFR